MLFTAKKPDVRKEIIRRKSQTQRMLELLKQQPHGNITNVHLQRIGHNYTMRISELRKEGHEILAEYVKPGVYRYFYKGQRG